MEDTTWIPIIVGIVCMVIVIFFITQSIQLDNICEDNGYEDIRLGGEIEPGYVKCCNNIYLNHELSHKECRIFKVNKWNIILKTVEFNEQ